MTAQPQPAAGNRPALVGRDTELSALEGLLTPTAPSRVALVTGAPGSGCTAMLQVVSDQAVAKETAVLAGFSRTDARQPYGGLLAPLLDPAPGSAAFPGLDLAWAAELRDLARAAARDPGGYLLALVERYASIVHAVAHGRIPVVFIDDLQAADAASLEILPLMARRLTTCRWFLAVHLPAGSQVPVRAAVGALIGHGLPSDTVHVQLRPLADADLATLVRQAVGMRPSEQLISSLARHLGAARGLPGPTLRLLTASRPQGRIRRIDTLGYFVDPDEPVALPVDDPLVVLVGPMDSPAARAAGVIATLGSVAPESLSTVAAALGLDEIRLGSQLDQLITRGVLRVDAAARLHFAVPAVAHALATGIPGQAEVHRALADALFASGEAHLSDQSYRLADHLGAIFSTTHGATPGGMDDAVDHPGEPQPHIASAFLSEAIVTAGHDVAPIRLGRWHRALLTVLTLMSTQPAAKTTPLVDQKMLAMLPGVLTRMRGLGYAADAADVGVRALTLIDQRGMSGSDGPPSDPTAGPALRAAIVVETAASLADRGEPDRSADLLVGMGLDELTDTGRLAQAAGLLCLTNRLSRARGLLTRPDRARDSAMATERVLLEAAYGDAGQWTDAWDAWKAAHPQMSTTVQPEVIRELICLGDVEAARTMLVMDGHSAWLDPPDSETRIGQAWLDGDWDHVVGMTIRLAALSSTAPPARTTAAMRALAAEVWQQRGEPRRALRWVSSVPDNHTAGPIVAWALGGALLGCGEPAAGQAILTTAVRRYLQMGRLNGVDLLLMRLIDQMIGIGDWDGADDAEIQLREVAEALGSRQARLLSLYARARIHKDPDAAEQALAAAVSAQMVFQQAKLHLLMGELGREPESHLQKAHALFQTLGARPWQQHVAVSLRDSGLSVPRRPAASAATTDADNEVIELVAAGLGNRQIATRLRISEKTVEGLLTRILAKTGARNRVELAVRHRQTPGQPQ